MDSNPGSQKLKRSRNGCNECRRLHRRCDEAKPECQSCLNSGKQCSYQKSLSWGGRPVSRLIGRRVARTAWGLAWAESPFCPFPLVSKTYSDPSTLLYQFRKGPFKQVLESGVIEISNTSLQDDSGKIEVSNVPELGS